MIAGLSIRVPSLGLLQETNLNTITSCAAVETAPEYHSGVSNQASLENEGNYSVCFNSDFLQSFSMPFTVLQEFLIYLRKYWVVGQDKEKMHQKFCKIKGEKR